jgi:alpha-D-xyloside xylohydrolase
MQQRVVDLPAGNWYDFYTGDFVGNGVTITVSSPGRMPLFVKDGAVIPLLARPVERTRDAYGCPLEVRHYGQAAGSFELYEDDGISFDYEKGAYSLRRFVFQDGRSGEELLKEGPRMFGEVSSWVDMTD